MRTYTRFIPGEEIGVVSQWDFGAVDAQTLRLAAKEKAHGVAAVQAGLETARQQGYAEGFAQGRARAELEHQHQMSEFLAHQGKEGAAQLAAVVVAAHESLVQTEGLIARGVLDLACDIARQVVRRELTSDPDVIAVVIRDSLRLLMADASVAQIRLNPGDLGRMDEALRQEFGNLTLSLVADPQLEPGSCVINSAGMVIDGTLPRRWARVVGALGADAGWEAPHAD